MDSKNNICQVGGTAISGTESDFLFVKYDSLGNIIFNKKYGLQGFFEVASDILETTDSGFLICGYRHHLSSGDRDILLIKTDSAGNFEWEKTYGGSYNDWGGYITKSLEGGYMIAGGFVVSPPTPNAIANGWLIKIDEQGNVQWEKKYLHEDLDDGAFWTGLKQLKDSSYVALGSTNAPVYEQGWIYKVDRYGNEIWSRTYTRDSTWHHYFYGFDTTADGGFVACGSTHLQGGTQDGWLIKLDSFGCNIPGCQLPDTPDGIWNRPVPGQALGKPYPNPFTDEVTIPYELAGNVGILAITDLLGKTIWQQAVAPGSSEVTVSGTELPRGVWLVVLREEGRVVGTRKIIAQ